MISHLHLQKKSTLSPSVSVKQDSNGYDFIVIEHPKLSAAFALHGAHLVHFQRPNEAPIIWLSKSALYQDGKAIRGGVPICWPWFGPAGEELGADLPAHGFARTQKWDMLSVNESEQGVTLEFLLKDNAETLKLWPFKFELRLKVTLDTQLKLELISTNCSESAFTYRGALHTYLNIGAPEGCLISGLNSVYKDSLQGGDLHSEQGTLSIDGAIDRIYKKSTHDILLTDKTLQRKLTIRNTGNDSNVLWSPWIKGAKAFVDMPDNGYLTMFCIESAITDPAGKEIQPGASDLLSTLIS
ncbi:aldose 1-epimerase [Psychromonas sp. CNPT3]|uniref:D-hexose-6-phosphate mutarotase n=1 Tax=Psychromonas sp. CNPT3 TaxID=314282 RepID=UPI00006E488F|nr:D-hexose-6-phosphate mutarotase [Psychromonas sp. CNPT3]AGH80999.1 aldose 1-epimerase [Psychromonas sp. CNPT3]